MSNSLFAVKLNPIELEVDYLRYQYIEENNISIDLQLNRFG
jgi:hypothetical protein